MRPRAGTILYAAHQKLEEITLDKETTHYKQQVALKFGEIVYNGQWYTPLRKALSAFVDSTQETVTGDVKLKLYKGNIIPASVTSPFSLYSEDMATFNEDDCYDQADSAGFINLFGLPLKVRALNDQMLFEKTGKHFRRSSKSRKCKKRKQKMQSARCAPVLWTRRALPCYFRFPTASV